MPKAIVLGAGMVGSVMAADLSADPEFEVSIADIRESALAAAAERARGRIRPIRADLSNPEEIQRLVKSQDVVLGALASAIGFQTLRTVIEAGKHYCDITFMPEDAWTLDELAKSRGVTAVVDCGVAPGMSNMLAGYAAAHLQPCERIAIYVGGLPRERRWPFQYKAGFSPHDVIEEYTRPARLVEHGRVVIKEALTEPELIDFDGVGTLEAFNTDGLRSLTHFLNVPFMSEKTMRYPGHIELMRVFRETGLFSNEPIEIAAADGGRARVRPIDVISALMFPMWSYAQGEEDLTVMRVIAHGRQGGQRVCWSWDLLDFYDRDSNATSMSRTTAFPCTIMARLIARGEFRQFGVIPPELIARQPGMLQCVLDDLAHRNIRFAHATAAAS